jgi:putative membrane-bound dehydrogenase-like protein
MLRRFRPLAILALMMGLEVARGDEARVLAQLERSRATITTPELWSQRRQELRRQFLIGARLWPLPGRTPSKATVHGRREHDGYSVENVALETLPGFYCTGNLYRPLGRTGPGPAVLCPHGHFRPLGRMREEHQVRCAQMARMGATVFSYSMVGWQDSRQTTHDDPLVLALQTWNSIRAVDFVAGLGGVDPRRIGVTGASGGGTQTLFLALVDDRIKASAPVVIVYPWADPDGCKCEGGLPIMRAAEANAIELAAAVAPRPQLIISVGNDPTERFPDVGVPFVRHMYGLAGGPDAFQHRHFADEAHDFGPSKRKAVYEFFTRHLGLVALPEDSGRITIEPPEAMEVFNAAHPLPPGSVQGSEAVSRAFASVFGPEEIKAAAVLDGPLAEYAFKPSTPADEALIFTPAGFEHVGVPAEAKGPEIGRVRIIIREAKSGELTPARVNVVGPDGDYYEPKDNPLRTYSLTGQWPKPGAWGNRPEKAPIRYLGRSFYCTGEAIVEVPPGPARVEVWKGLEYRPESATVQVHPGATERLEIGLSHAVDMPGVGLYSGDTHVHIARISAEDDRTILDLMEAEDIHHATMLAYNEPAGPYDGLMDNMASPQRRGLGRKSLLARGAYHVLSGQEYRSATYGHMNLFLLDELVFPGESRDANNWPLYGDLAREVRERGGLAVHDHGGYAQEVYADVVQGNVDAIELLQFGVYRGIGLIDWYRMLNCGFRVPIVGACDYPACRKFGDALTYVSVPGPAGIEAWLRGSAAGRGFVTTGPLILFDVDGRGPGETVEAEGNCTVRARARVRSEVAPVTTVQIIVNGRVAQELKVPEGQGRGTWLTLDQPMTLDRSAWVAVRASSLSRLGTPDSEAHTNPVFVTVAGKAPYERASLDVLVRRIDDQIIAHKKRTFPEQARVIAYFERSRDILLRIRDAGGAPAKGHPSDIARNEPTLLDPGRREHTEEELKAFLRPVPPRPIEEVLRGFEAVDGFQMELVAREPLVASPVAAAFDEDGNLYVAEMRDYPYKPQEGSPPLGTVRLLIDKDHDGTFDEGHVFADELLWAAGIAPWKGGVFVAAPPHIWYLKDTDGDHKADIRERVFTGFGTQNQQAMLNNLQWWLDHKIYGSTAGNGGTVRPVGQPDARPLRLDGHDFRFDPVTRTIEPQSGCVQFGNTFDDWGNRFLCSESRPLIHVVLPEQYLARNPYLPVPGVTRDLAPSPVPIFRISPIERWRQVRSSRRIAHNDRSATAAGASHHVVDAAAGVTVYRGGAFPPRYHGTVFVGDAQNNLIHHRLLEPDGVTFNSRRAEGGTEFLRSPDIWFRPVNFVNAPDGTLYVLDMSREVLESIHIPNDVVKYLDLTSGRETGRIYRIAPPGFRYPGPPRLSQASTAELVAALESPHGWWRDTAHRLIYERQDRAAVGPLRRIIAASESPQARLCALWSLEGLGVLSDEDLQRALRDGTPQVREQALVLSEPRLDTSTALLGAVLRLLPDEQPRVRFQLTFTLGASRHPRAVAGLTTLAQDIGGDPWLRAALLSSAVDSADDLLTHLISLRGAPDTNLELLGPLAAITGARDRPEEVGRVLGALTSNESAAVRSTVVLALGNAVRRRGGRLDALVAEQGPPRALVGAIISEALRAAGHAGTDTTQRQRAIELLSCVSFRRVRDTLTALVDNDQPEPIQTAAIRALSSYDESDVTALLLDRFRSFTPAVRSEAIEALLAREGRTVAFLDALQADPALATQLDTSRRSLLRQHRSEAVRSRAGRLFGPPNRGSRQQVILSYQPALQGPRDPTRGQAVFKRECAACHRLGDTGHVVGPDLTSSAQRDAEALLVHILDPNRYVQPNWSQYQVVTKDGRVASGLLASQGATSVTLRREEDRVETVLRTDIEELRSSGQSLMPEGFETRISSQEMADLVAFLQAAQAASPAGEPPLDIGTLPGLIEPVKEK